MTPKAIPSLYKAQALELAGCRLRYLAKAGSDIGRGWAQNGRMQKPVGVREPKIAVREGWSSFLSRFYTHTTEGVGG